MKRYANIIAALAIALGITASGHVKPGIETLRDDGFAALQGKRIGLITNPTGVDSDLRPTADILAAAPGVDLVAFFAPEHGIRGDVVAGSKVSDTVDQATGIKVYSIYGANKRPTKGMLAGIDALVYDIQDNGCRSYTFISTMGRAMEAAAEAGIEFIVLDRPNPLGGEKIEGLMTDEDCISFVSQFPIPYLYGMTPGELAQYLQGEELIKGAADLRLTVIPMEGWERDMTYKETGLPWVLPSPHIPLSETCIYYPASGIVGELDFISIGVGYTLPFKTFAAPWIDGAKLAAKLNALSLPGTVFRPIYYKPFYGKHKGEQVSGVEVFVVDPAVASLTEIQFHVLEALAQLYPSQKALAPTEKNANNLKMFDQVVGSKEIRRRLVTDGYKAESILPLWRRDTERFCRLREPYLIY